MFTKFQHYTLYAGAVWPQNICCAIRFVCAMSEVVGGYNNVTRPHIKLFNAESGQKRIQFVDRMGLAVLYNF